VNTMPSTVAEVILREISKGAVPTQSRDLSDQWNRSLPGRMRNASNSQGRIRRRFDYLIRLLRGISSRPVISSAGVRGVRRSPFPGLPVLSTPASGFRKGI
jgi:hypothetical protein